MVFCRANSSADSASTVETPFAPDVGLSKPAIERSAQHSANFPIYYCAGIRGKSTTTENRMQPRDKNDDFMPTVVPQYMKLIDNRAKMIEGLTQLVEREHSKTMIHPVKSESQLSELSADATVATDASESTVDSDRRITFGSIQVREYERVVGDHPDTRIGVPISIGWAYCERDAVPLEKYEADRITKGNLRMSSITRKNILHNVFGISEEEIRSAEKEVQKIKKSRERTNKQSDVSAKSQSAMKGFRRRVKKVLNAEAFMKGISAVASSGMMLPVSH